MNANITSFLMGLYFAAFFVIPIVMYYIACGTYYIIKRINKFLQD